MARSSARVSQSAEHDPGHSISTAPGPPTGEAKGNSARTMTEAFG